MAYMKIKFKQKWRYAERGINVISYEKGKTYDVSEETAKRALDLRVATKVLTRRGTV